MRSRNEILRDKGDSEEKTLRAENKVLKEKLAATEANVGIFVREMGSLLDQHEPPGIDENVQRTPGPLKGTKHVRAGKTKTRVLRGTSPEDSKFSHLRRSVERKPYLQFD